MNSPVQPVDELVNAHHEIDQYFSWKQFLFTLFSTFTVFLGGQLSGGILTAFVIAVALKPSEAHLMDLLDNNVYVHALEVLCIEVLTVWLVLRLLRWRVKKPAAIGLGRRPQWKDLWRGALGFGMYAVLFLIVTRIVDALHLINVDQKQQLGFNTAHGHELLATFAALVILPPIAEEILFRGYLFFGLKETVRPLTAGIITSLLFGAAHLEFGSGPLNWGAAMSTGLLSAVLTYNAHKYNSVWPGMVTHALNNTMAFLYMFVFIK